MFIVSGVNIVNGSLKTPIGEPAGFIKWEKTYDTEHYDFGNCIQQTNDDGYICVGEGDGYKVWLFKINEVGTIQWSKYFVQGWPDQGRYVIQTIDKGYAIIGYREFPKNYPVQGRDVWVIKTGEKLLIYNDISKQIGNTPFLYQLIFNSNGFLLNLMSQILQQLINSR